MTELTPALLAALATARHPDDAFMRFDEFLGGLPMGVPLFSLFAANPPLMTLVAGLMGDAPRLAQHLARHPTVLYGVLGRDFHAALPSAAELAADLDAVLADTDNDQGAVLDAARRWTNDRRFQVGVHTLQGWIDPSQAGQAFADIADCVTGRMARLVEQELAAAYGAIPGGEWCVIGMGKMGGREMTATSDLDLILIYDAPPEVEDSAGPRALPVSTWFARFTARLVTALTAQTGEGALYEVDMRLRPSGNKGPIATSLESFRRYQAEAAWTWEHMALTRARVVAGDAAVTAKVEAAIHATLATRRDPDKLKADVADMRRRMAETHKAKTRWEVKYWRGGLVDIEFVVQYLQLAHAREHPEILERNTGAALARLSHAGCLTQTDSDALETAWRLCSAVQMVLRQTLAGDFNEATAPAGVKDLLARAAGVGDFRSLGDRLEDCTALAFEVFERVVENPPS